MVSKLTHKTTENPMGFFLRDLLGKKHHYYRMLLFTVITRSKLILEETMEFLTNALYGNVLSYF